MDAPNAWKMTSPPDESSIFALRGDLDGAKQTTIYTEAKQFIGLMVANEEFLLPIEVMNEIIMITQITFVPGAPAHVEGVINLRGKILPAINLRTLMAHEPVVPAPASRIVICNLDGHSAGLIVDGITNVIPLKLDEIEEQSFSHKGKGAEFIKGISKRADRVNGILDLLKIYTAVGGADFNQQENQDAAA